ncbi:MAG: glycoside hydrolase family 3 C-terminal domain-containing protein [Bacteroidales bacterium]|nr:glycoside hydrolase family 3 C-terminal domain-containing protein [Bacteroidales bacterium]
MPEETIRFEPPVSLEVASAWADSMVGLMTLDEKISLIGGDRIFYTNGIERLGIPPVLFADATQGVHLRDSWFGGEYIYEQALPKSTAFPSPILLASTWNKQLAHDYAEAIGEECRAGAIPVLLGPGMNIYRHSQCGRNFEYFGEDPFLAARMIENYVVGLQNTGTIATLKHFVANNTDFFRRKSNSIVDERTLHEIYLPAFKAGIDAGAMAVMTSYNLVNGEWTGQSDYVINKLLRQELGFQWLVMTDWWSVYDGEKTIRSGQDLEMPFRLATEQAASLLREGKVDEPDIDRMVTSILKTLYAMKAFGREKDENFDQWDAHEEIALQTAREGIVLLRNENNILPVEDDRKILLTGEYADKVAVGGGAANVKGYRHVVLSDALEDLYHDQLTVSLKASDEEIREADVVILNIGTYDSEGADRPYDLPKETEAEIDRVCALNHNVVLVVNSGSGVNLSRCQKKLSAILYAWYPGQNGAAAIAEIIYGKTNPSGKLPISLEKDFRDSPGYGYLPDGEQLYSGWNDEKEKLYPVYDVRYDEGIFVGYRWYESKGIVPLYPFGYGLSYTDFHFSDLKVSESRFGKSDKLIVTVSVKNTGSRSGAEVVQLYIADEECSVPRPQKELKAFEKVELKPGETKEVSMVLDVNDFSFWSPDLKEWTAEPGTFNIMVGPSSAEMRYSARVILQ